MKDAITLRRVNHAADAYPKGAKISLPDDLFDAWQSAGIVKAAAKFSKAKPA